jgi:hypothetical protein
MKPKEAFGVAVRIIGLLVTLASVAYLLSAIILAINPHYRPDAHPAIQYLISGLVLLICGLYLLSGASHIVRFAYREKTPLDGPPRQI